MRTALTIAGSDSCGGAGIQADIKTMTAHGVYAMSAVTALTAQNRNGVYGIMEVTPKFLAQQLDCIFTDIYPGAVKIGMLPSGEIIRTTAKKLRQYEAKHIVLDTVMVSTSGTRLMKEDALHILQQELFPLAEVITPNIPEAEALTGITIHDEKTMEQAAKQLGARFRCDVLLKGGHRTSDANDLLCTDKTLTWIVGKRIESANTHGTGCKLSSAIASNLANGLELEEAVRRAKAYMFHVLSAQSDLENGGEIK